MKKLILSILLLFPFYMGSTQDSPPMPGGKTYQSSDTTKGGAKQMEVAKTTSAPMAAVVPPPSTNIFILSWPTNVGTATISRTSDLINWENIATNNTGELTVNSLSSFLLFRAAIAAKLKNVSLAWNTNTSPNIAGYRIYHGIKSRVYTNNIDAGKLTSLTVSNLFESTTNYFAATAYSTAGIESEFSDELVYKIPTTNLFKLNIRAP